MLVSTAFSPHSSTRSQLLPGSPSLQLSLTLVLLHGEEVDTKQTPLPTLYYHVEGTLLIKVDYFRFPALPLPWLF